MVNPIPTMQVSAWDSNTALASTPELFTKSDILNRYAITLCPVFRMDKNLQLLFFSFLSEIMLPGYLLISPLLL